MNNNNIQQKTLPDTPSLAYFECVLDAFPISVLCSIVDSTKGRDSVFDPFEREKDEVIRQFVKHCVRSGKFTKNIKN